MKRYYVERLGRRLLETTSWTGFKSYLAHAVAPENLDLFTSDFEGRCSDADCKCRIQLGFSEVEQTELLDEFELDVT